MNKKIINIHNIFISPKHNYFTREKFKVGEAPTFEYESVELEYNRGLKGDRFEFSKYPITFFSLEVAQEVCKSLSCKSILNEDILEPLRLAKIPK